MVQDILNVAFSGFWSWLGIFLLISMILSLVFKFIIRIWTRFMRMLMVRKHGWPPSHLDADGDWPELEN